MNLALTVHSLRTKHKLTQEALGRLCGISKQTICDIEKGRKNPSLPVLCALAKALKTTPNYLLK